VVDFDKIDEWADLVKGDDLFSAMGTTLKGHGAQPPPIGADGVQADA
jgi:hypothetical protein